MTAAVDRLDLLTEDPVTRARRHTTKAYLTFVAIDERGRPREVPPLVLESDADRRRHAAAEMRRDARIEARPRAVLLAGR